MENTEKLPDEFKAKWIEALRSGKYRQGKSHLQTGNSFCCLGVACAISGHDFLGSLEWIDNPLDEYENETHIFDSMPSIIRGDDGIAAELASMNDEGKSFFEIADWIAENL